MYVCMNVCMSVCVCCACVNVGVSVGGEGGTVFVAQLQVQDRTYTSGVPDRLQQEASVRALMHDVLDRNVRRVFVILGS